MKSNLNIQIIVAAILAIGGLVLLFCGTYIDPAGQIHETLLVAFGEVMTFAGSLMGIDYHYKTKTKNDANNNPYQKPADEHQSGDGQNIHPLR